CALCTAGTARRNRDFQSCHEETAMKSVIGMTMATVGLFAMTSGAGHAGVTIEIKDNGSDISVTASGTLNMTALTESIASLGASGPGISDFGSDIRSSQALVLGEPTVLSY